MGGGFVVHRVDSFAVSSDDGKLVPRDNGKVVHRDEGSAVDSTFVRMDGTVLDLKIRGNSVEIFCGMVSAIRLEPS